VRDHHREIEALLHRYAEAIDAGDFDAVGALFAHGTVCAPDGTPIAEGAAAVTRLYETTTRRHEDGTPKTRHIVTNVTVERDTDSNRASVRSRFTVYQATDALPLQPIIVGDYEDDVELVDDRWVFRRRVMRPALLGDLSQHLLIELPPRSGD
jgi:3-phenylpropionate/cinnamic acid dioxygenase small subunit